MILLAKIIPEGAAIEGVIILLIGTLFGYLLKVWKDRTMEEATTRKEQEILENARQQAENVFREARFKSNEEALKQRDDFDRQYLERRKELSAAEKRIVERETLLNQQLENLVQQEKE